MNARDELAELLDRVYYDYELGYLPDDENLEYVQADAVLLSGWRKMPSRDELARAIALGVDGVDGEQFDDAAVDYRLEMLQGADAVLALMDRGQ